MKTKPSLKIDLQNVNKSFAHKQVLRNLNLQVETGTSLVIMGGSGSGKSVLLKCILGLLKVDSGQILIDGQDTTRLKGRAYEKYLDHFSMLFQGAALFDSLTVWENVVFGLSQKKKISKNDAIEMATITLASVGLKADVAFLYPSELSGGMQRRVAIARAIIDKPEIIFFDEPTAGLDPIISNVINELIMECSETLGVTSITITHDINSARRIAKQVAMIHDGLIIWEGSVKDMDHSNDARVDQFIHGKTRGPIEMELRH